MDLEFRRNVWATEVKLEVTGMVFRDNLLAKFIQREEEFHHVKVRS